MTSYTKIRFIGYAIPTTPQNLQLFGNEIAGTYLGHDDLFTDVAARVAVLANAAATAKASLPKEDPGTVINVFMAPEFFFHGPKGPYLFSSLTVSPYADPVAMIVDKLQAALPAAEYPNWVFVGGTIITGVVDQLENLWANPKTQIRNQTVKSLALASLGIGSQDDLLNAAALDLLADAVQRFQRHPVITLRDRAVIISNVPACSVPSITGLTTPTFSTREITIEKDFLSQEDLVLFDPSGAEEIITEQMAIYPKLDLTGGDLKREPFDEYAIFRIDQGNPSVVQPLTVGLEICADHYDLRLRHRIDNPMFPAGVHVQLVTSCGQQLRIQSIAANDNGFVFNCDGQAAVEMDVKMSTDFSIHADYTPDDVYGAHTQLARVKQRAKGPFPNAPGAQCATFSQLDPATITKVPVPAVADLGLYYAGGPGEVHIYGCEDPYTIFPMLDPATNAPTPQSE